MQAENRRSANIASRSDHGRPSFLATNRAAGSRASAAASSTLEDIADIQLAPDLLQTDGLALVSEGGGAPGCERADAATGLAVWLVNRFAEVEIGTIDPTTGEFTQIGGATGLPALISFVPVFDPTANAFVELELPRFDGRVGA
jgi:hypothetical protein